MIDPNKILDQIKIVLKKRYENQDLDSVELREDTAIMDISSKLVFRYIPRKDRVIITTDNGLTIVDRERVLSYLLIQSSNKRLNWLDIEHRLFNESI